jgi:hypothetical protein
MIDYIKYSITFVLHNATQTKNYTMEIILHYNCLQVYFRYDEVTFGGETFVCKPLKGVGITNIPPTDSRNWRKKQKSTDEMLAEVHQLRCRNMHDHELLMPILRPVEWNEDFLKAIQTEMLKRQSN